MPYQGDYELSAAMEALTKEPITTMPAPKPTLESQSTIGVAASQKSLIRTPSTRTMIAGFSRASPALPREARHEIVQEMHDIRYNVIRSPLKRPIQLIPPNVHKDASFIVPGLINNHNLGSSFATGIGLSLQNPGEKTAPLEARYAATNPLPTPKQSFTARSNSMEVTLNQTSAEDRALKKDLVLSKIDERLEKSLMRINQ